MSFQSYPFYKDATFKWTSSIPAHWAIGPIKLVTSYNDDVLEEHTLPDQRISYVEISDVNAVDGISGFTNTTFGAAPSRARRLVRHGDVLISTVRTYLRAIAQIKHPPANLVVSTGFSVFRPRSVNPGFSSYLFQAEFIIAEVISRSKGVSYPAINACDIGSIKVPLPPPDEQGRIAAFLDQETAHIDSSIKEQYKLLAL